MGPTLSAWLKAICVLACGAFAVALADSAWKSVTQHQPQYTIEADLPAGEPLARRVVLVVLDGIRVDQSARMPHLQALAQRGASGVALTVSPSLSNPARAAMATGTSPVFNGVMTNDSTRPPPVDSIFSIARRLGVPMRVAGSQFWRTAFGEYLSGQFLEFEKEPHLQADVAELVAWQSETCRRMAPFLAQQPSGLLVAGLTASDSAGHDFGGLSEQYREVSLAVDNCLGALVEALDDGETTFLIVADHGHIDRRGQGGHGGSEDEVMRAPIVLAGKAARQSAGWQASITDIAPTICALLGLPLPANNQGGILWSALEAPAEIQAELQARENAQRTLLASRLPDFSDLVRQSQSRRIAPSVAAAMILLAGFVVAARSSGVASSLIAAAAFLVLYGVLFRAFGLAPSLSAIVREEYLNAFFGKNLAAALLAFLPAAWFAARLARHSARSRYLDLALACIAALGLQVALRYYQHGLFLEHSLPDLTASFQSYLDLQAILAIALAAPLAMAVETAAFFVRTRGNANVT